MPHHFVASDLVLHCLPMFHRKDASLKYGLNYNAKMLTMLKAVVITKVT